MTQFRLKIAPLKNASAVTVICMQLSCMPVQNQKGSLRSCIANAPQAVRCSEGNVVRASSDVLFVDLRGGIDKCFDLVN